MIIACENQTFFTYYKKYDIFFLKKAHAAYYVISASAGLDLLQSAGSMLV